MRLFYGLELPEDVRARAGAWLEDARVRSQAFRGARVDWTAAANLHVTLKFLGQVKENEVPGVLAEGTEAARHAKPFRLSVGGLGAFPSGDSKPARILWAGVQEPTGRLGLLVQSLEARLEGLGFIRETRPFHPHLTLGRVKDGSRGRELLTGLADFGEVEVSSLALFESWRDAQGTRYVPLRRFDIER